MLLIDKKNIIESMFDTNTHSYDECSHVIHTLTVEKL